MEVLLLQLLMRFWPYLLMMLVIALLSNLVAAFLTFPLVGLGVLFGNLPPGQSVAGIMVGSLILGGALMTPFADKLRTGLSGSLPGQAGAFLGKAASAIGTVGPVLEVFAVHNVVLGITLTILEALSTVSKPLAYLVGWAVFLLGRYMLSRLFVSKWKLGSAGAVGD